MAGEIEITYPQPFRCLPTTNADVTVRYKMDPDAFIPPLTQDQRDEMKKAVTLTTFKVVAKVGADPEQAVWVPYSEVWNEKTVRFASLTAADDVTVTAKLVYTTPNPDVEFDTDAVAHVNVSIVCVVDSVIIDGALQGPGQINTRAVGVGTLPTPTPQFLHKTVRCKYLVVPGSTVQIHRVVAVVSRVLADGDIEIGREVWASVEATMQGGIASAIIPIPPPATANTYYEYHFVQIRNTTNAMDFRTPAVKLP